VPDNETQDIQSVAQEGDTKIVTSHKKVAEALIKFHGIHDGIWGLFIRFGLGASNMGPNDNEVNPTAIVPVMEIGLQKFDREGALSVDAAKVNPRSPQ
jgi:hypothetical protein